MDTVELGISELTHLKPDQLEAMLYRNMRERNAITAALQTHGLTAEFHVIEVLSPTAPPYEIEVSYSLVPFPTFIYNDKDIERMTSND